MMEWIVTSTAMILIVIALRSLLKEKISLKLQYGLWALVLVRLLIPFSVAESGISVSNVLSAPVIRQADQAVTQYQEHYQAIRNDHARQGDILSDDELRLQVQQQLYDRAYANLTQQYTQRGETVSAEQIQTEAQQQVEVISLAAVVTEALPWLWVVGMAAVAAILIGSNLSFRWNLLRTRQLLEMPDIPIRVYLSDYVATPCLFGMIKPDIYLTPEVVNDPEMRRHVISHELTHYRHGDHIWSVLRCVCLVLHWYNPLVWVAAVLSKQDAELACDEATIRVLGEGERTAYGQTLIGMTCVRRDPGSLMLTATTMLGTKKTLKERITLIAKKPKTALYTLVACVLVAAIAVGCTFTGAHTYSDNDLIDRCRDAVKHIQSLTYFEITERTEITESADSNVVGRTYEKARFVHSENDWFHTLISADWTWQFICKDGNQYRKDITSAVPQEDIPYPNWTGGNFDNVYYAAHSWIMDMEWTDDGFTVERNSVATEYSILSVSVEQEGETEWVLLETEIRDGPEAIVYVVFKFGFNGSNEITTIVKCVGEKHYSGSFDSVSTLTIVPGTKAEMSAIIDGIYYAEIDPNADTPTEPPTEPVTEPTAPDDVLEEPDDLEATQEELLERAKFQDLLSRENGYWYRRAMGCIFEDPEEISLYYLLYNGVATGDRQYYTEFADNEVAFLKDVAVNSTWRDESAWMNAHKMPRQYIDDMLHDYFGVSIEDVTIPEEWSYFEETDSYYYIRSDAYGVEGYTMTDVQTDDNGLVYIYWTTDYIRDTRIGKIKFIDQPQMVMVLEETDEGSYRIRMNMPVEELLNTEDEEYFQNLLTSQNGYWYWRAMGCIFDAPENIDMATLCYAGMEKRILYSTFTDDEIAFLKSRFPANGFDDSPWSNAIKLPRQELETVMQTYFGVSLEDVNIPWVYYAETDAYYHVKYDSYGLVGYTVTNVEYHDDGTVSVYWHVPFGLWDTRDPENDTSLNDADMVLTLKDNGDGTYMVLSNLPVE